MRPAPLLALLCACATAAPEADYVKALREEYRALGHIQSLLDWYVSTQGETSLGRLTYLGHDRLFRKQALDAVGAAQAQPGLQPNEALALRFLRRALTSETVGVAVAPFDDQYADAAASATVLLPWKEQPVSFRDVPLVIAQEPDAQKRAQAYAAMNAVRVERLNPILLKKEEAAQRAAHDTGYADYVALSEELRGVKLDELLAQGIGYLKATEALFRAQLDRVAQEELGIPREKLRLADTGRLWKAPRLSKYFGSDLELRALQAFLGGIGLDLRTATGTEVKVDDSLHPKKVPRAFVDAVDAPGDVRLSVKPTGGLDDYETLFHESGHAVHFAAATILPVELKYLGDSAPTEGFGEFFRHVFSDPRWLSRYRAFLEAQGRPAPSSAELSAILRRLALKEMYYLRRYSFAKIAYELRLHGRPASEITPALALLPAPDKAAADLRELYRQLFSAAYAFDLNDEESQAYLTDVDDTFYAADYARAFVLAGMMHEGVRRRFGDDWYGNPAVGKFLRAELFEPGMSLTAEEVAQRLGFAPRLDFEAAARRAVQLIAQADALEAGLRP